MDEHYLAFFRHAVRTLPGQTEPPDDDHVESEAARLLRNFSQSALLDRQRMFVSCWHANCGESEALWRFYCPPPAGGVAIQTTAERLTRALGEIGFTLGRVQYVDFSKKFAGIHERVFAKRKSLSHENEVRAVIRELRPPEAVGMPVPVDLQALIARLVPSPFAPAWFTLLLESALRKYGMPTALTRSEILAEPPTDARNFGCRYPTKSECDASRFESADQDFSLLRVPLRAQIVHSTSKPVHLLVRGRQTVSLSAQHLVDIGPKPPGPGRGRSHDAVTMSLLQRRRSMLPLIAPVFALLVFAQAPAGWSDTQARGSRLLAEGKSAEAIALYEKVLQTSPNFDEAHYALAEAHELAADNLKPQGVSQAASRRRHLEAAAVHYRRVIDLRSAHAPMAMRSLAVVYGKDGLNRLVDAELFARQLVQARPTSVVWHVMLARLIFDQGRDADATDVLHNARTVVQAGDRNMFAIALTDTVVERSALSPSLARILVDDALALAEQGLKSDPDNRDLLMTKAAAFELLATRIEPDPKRREAFKKEASNVFDRFHEIGLRERGVPKEWAQVQERTNDLQANGKITEAVEVFQTFLKTYPKFGPAYTSLGMAYLTLSPPPPPPPPPPSGSAAKPKTAPPTAAPPKASPEQLKNFELARAAFQRSVDLAPPSDELPEAYLLLVQMYASTALNRPAEREALLQTAITKYPTDPAGHFALIREKLAAGNVAAVDTLMKNARVAIPATYRGRLGMARATYALVLDPDVRAPEARRLLTDAVAAIDEALKLEPKSPDALWQKSTILNLQAERETDPQRARALRAEAERLSARAKAGGGI